MAVPVHIISGFLGTGKTTAIRAQLEARRGERVAVIVNDFGEAALDEATLSEGAPFRITNIAGACVCCTAPEGFLDALGAVLAEGPQCILIEPTGLARPQDLVDTILRGPHRDALALGPVVVLVDPARLDAGDTWREQLAAADVLVANRSDLADAAALARFDALAAKLWPAPLAVHRTSHGRLPASAFEWPEGAAGGAPRAQPSAGAHAHAHSTREHSSRSWSWPRSATFSRERVLAALAPLRADPEFARFKGIFRTREGVLRFEIAGGALHEEASAFRRDSRADAIVQGEAAGLLDGLAAGLEAAVLSPSELEQQAHQIEIALPDGRVEIVDRARLEALPDPVPDVAALVPKRSGRAARVGRLFQRLGIEANGHAVVCAADGFASEPVPLRALAGGVLLHSLAGAALTPEQGGPFRLLIPPGVPDAPSACANVKAVTRIVIRPA